MCFGATAPVTWRRQHGPDYLGTVDVADGYVRLVGRDPETGIDVSLSVPVDQIEAVRKSGRDAVLELTDSQAIYVRGLSPGPGVPPSLEPLLSSSPCSIA